MTFMLNLSINPRINLQFCGVVDHFVLLETFSCLETAQEKQAKIFVSKGSHLSKTKRMKSFEFINLDQYSLRLWQLAKTQLLSVQYSILVLVFNNVVNGF